uniref:Uncharacterized protein n=1 Tax=Nelumbo nucifera TaxID=4432 RepID=A0A822YD20_NELNU|nr:TPA_asm: hypothetical protein HUJ06_030343 [Nelumbo nucifera]
MDELVANVCAWRKYTLSRTSLDGIRPRANDPHHEKLAVTELSR